MKESFPQEMAERETLGSIYRDLDARYGEQVQIFYLDPRNTLIMVAYFGRHVRKRHLSIKEAFNHLFKNMKREAIFVNGKYMQNYEQLIAEIEGGDIL